MKPFFEWLRSFYGHANIHWFSTVELKITNIRQKTAYFWLLDSGVAVRLGFTSFLFDYGVPLLPLMNQPIHLLHLVQL
jgi:hypothetical protein